MSSDEVIRVEGLSKCYALYERPYHRLKQFVLPRVQRMAGRKPGCYYREFWALRDVSFSIRKGEALAIIGRNGSGKSTLLQLICGTLNPSLGLLHTQGRIAALLELGSGFNPEFTGRENVYLNASILGLSKAQIDERFDKIRSFADIGEFIDQPVKCYSSGMMLRLAFAVIAHVDADILVIDEALAVGDAVFTQKCMRFIRRFRSTGTLVFVSHEMGSVLNLCDRALWLHEGRLQQIGDAKTIAEQYLHFTQQLIYSDEVELQQTSVKPVTEISPQPSQPVDYGSEFYVDDNLSDANGWKTGAGEILSVEFENLSAPGAVLQGGETVRLRIRAVAHQSMEAPILGFVVRDRLGQDLFGENTLIHSAESPLSVSAHSLFESGFEFVLPMLPNGQYSVMASLADGDLYQHIQHHLLHDALILTVSSSKVRWGLVGVRFHRVFLRETQ
ncbi:Teichoic acid export ATP-binding protein TagH [Nitrincola lacisaponensis]|uniref:Teichoic acid export ATP-binding protein TagH n=1 Tax=Nitrincola lacisaponensis TaxID=267850 RepID=A0A063YA03_9GAMM|nr:ABC transporter ATP-binding protein [Nitrincola lacisaponensis]KDE41167.1 Teichoic acid export ATP-binding protein TagH [Nitrincola lacisaponensis]